MQSIPPTTANKQTQAQKKRGRMARKLLGANAKMPEGDDDPKMHWRESVALMQAGG